MSRVTAGSVAVGVIGVGAVIWFADPTTPGGLSPPCPIDAFLHVNCPGCGSARCLYSLMHGDLARALRYNVLLVVVLVSTVLAAITYAVARWRDHRLPVQRHAKHASLAFLAAALIWFVVRNIPVAPFDSLKV